MSEGSGCGLDDPIRLTDLLDAEDCDELVGSFADLHGVGVALIGPDGEIVARARGGPEAPSESDTGHRFRQPVVYDHERLGELEIGPYAPGQLSDDRAAAAGAAALRVLGVMLHAGHARHLAKAVHVAAMDDTYAQLAAKNEQLQQAVSRLQEVDRLKSAFLATVSHELRTPLTSVIGYSEMLLEGLAGDLNEEQRDYLSTILAKADQLLHIITGILDVSLIESGSIKLACEPLDMGEVVDTVLRSFEPQARREDIALVAAADGARPDVRVLCDPGKLRQVVTHLVANAIKFTRKGGRIAIKLDVGPMERVAEPGPFGAPDLGATPRGLRMSVEDSGIGISQDKQGRIFEPFFQVDSSSTREYGGTGLGLTLVKSYVEAHGGHVWVDSVLGQGSRFTVSLPAVEEDLAAYLARHPPSQS